MSLLRQIETEARYGSAQGTTNGTTAVEMAAPPESGFARVVEACRVVQQDTVAAAVRVKVVDDVLYSTGDVDVSLTLAAGASWKPIDRENRVVLTGDSALRIVLDSPVTTTELDWYVAWVDVPAPA